MFNKEKWKNLNLNEYKNEIKKETDHNHVVIDVIDFESYDYPIKTDKLKGIPFGIKDNFSLRNSVTSAASKIIREFKPNYTATIYKKLIEHGAIPLVKTNLDELAMGGSGLTSNYGEVHHPYRQKGLIGGSSSGSAYIVASGHLPFSIGSDTGDSVRKPAAYAGIVGFKPTWGIVSRYGMYDFAPTWDTVSWFTNSVDESAVLLDLLQAHDSKDSSSLHPKQENYEKKLYTDNKFKLGTIPLIVEEVVDKEIIKNYNNILDNAKADGHSVVKLNPDTDILKTILLVYRTISSIESFSMNASLTGFLYGSYLGTKGSYDEKITQARTKGFTYEVKRRFLLGMEAILNDSEIYHKARKARTLIIKELDKMFKDVDALVMPSHSYIAPSADDKNPLKYGSLIDDYLGLFNANGSPSITIPTNNDKQKPTALNISTKPFNDLEALQIAKILESYNE